MIWRHQIALGFPNQIYSFRHSEIYFSVLNVLSSPSLTPGRPAASPLLFIYQLNLFRWQVLLSSSFFNGETEAQKGTAHSLSPYITCVLLTSVQLPTFCFCRSYCLEFPSFWPWPMEVLAILPSPGTCHILVRLSQLSPYNIPLDFFVSPSRQLLCLNHLCFSMEFRKRILHLMGTRVFFHGSKCNPSC